MTHTSSADCPSILTYKMGLAFYAVHFPECYLSIRLDTHSNYHGGPDSIASCTSLSSEIELDHQDPDHTRHAHSKWRWIDYIGGGGHAVCIFSSLSRSCPIACSGCNPQTLDSNHFAPDSARDQRRKEVEKMIENLQGRRGAITRRLLTARQKPPDTTRAPRTYIPILSTFTWTTS